MSSRGPKSVTKDAYALKALRCKLCPLSIDVVMVLSRSPGAIACGVMVGCHRPLSFYAAAAA